jgi:hypothetical protein
VVARFPNILEEIRGVPAFTKLILCKLDDVALVTNLHFRTDISLNAE